ncbi:tyrosine-protein phosphatase non-receptor type substrate 1-like [Protopterus annectens]|uniref:tyrosine-protein phosphatase non-receptor type substrate 1-like n=1 Tax=Protopterus annectens TaxID=7888 RepID=UPI001CF95930|nr:tyrosine-protein phosphatase non-receptor type substrate 1-like [Protopterus annectens]
MSSDCFRIRKILEENWNVIQGNQDIIKVVGSKPNFVFRKNNTLKMILERASTHNTVSTISSKKGKPSPPSISGPNQQVWLNSYVTLSCLSAGFYPKEISITWWQNEMEFQNETITVSSYNGNKTYEVQSNITVQAKIDSSFTCRINHTALQQPMNSTFQITNIVNDPSSPSISGPRERVLLNTSMALTCTSEGFYPKDINVTWWQNGAEIKESKQDVTLYGINQTYKVQSNITVPGKIDSTVTCRINHRALQQPKEAIFNMNDLLKGIPSHPSISGPTAQVVLNTNVTLRCASQGFYPREINVTWLQHGRELQGSTSDIHLYGKEKTYRVLSNITVPAKIDSPVTCRINHTALDQPVNSTFEMNSIVEGKLSFLI